MKIYGFIARNRKVKTIDLEITQDQIIKAVAIIWTADVAINLAQYFHTLAQSDALVKIFAEAARV